MSLAAVYYSILPKRQKFYTTYIYMYICIQIEPAYKPNSVTYPSFRITQCLKLNHIIIITITNLTNSWSLYIYLSKSSLTILITTKSIIKSLSPGVIKLTRLEPPLAAVMSIKTKIKQGKHNYVS